MNVTWLLRTPAISVGDGRPSNGEAKEVLVDARARASQRGRQHWTAAFPRLEAWIMSRPVSASGSGPVSEISSLVSGDDFDYNLLVSTPSPLVPVL